MAQIHPERFELFYRNRARPVISSSIRSRDLQRIIAGFAGADADHILHVIDKDLAVADLAGVQRRIGRGDDKLGIDSGHDDVDLKLRREMHAHFNAGKRQKSYGFPQNSAELSIICFRYDSASVLPMAAAVLP